MGLVHRLLAAVAGPEGQGPLLQPGQQGGQHQAAAPLLGPQGPPQLEGVAAGREAGEGAAGQRAPGPRPRVPEGRGRGDLGDAPGPCSWGLPAFRVSPSALSPQLQTLTLSPSRAPTSWQGMHAQLALRATTV